MKLTLLVFTLYDQQATLMELKVEKLAKKAGLTKVPILKISKDEHIPAKASVLRKDDI